jgi:hypothetical protein
MLCPFHFTQFMLQARDTKNAIDQETQQKEKKYIIKECIIC